MAQALKYAIHSEPRLKGIKIGSKSYKMSQFADDTVLAHRMIKVVHAFVAECQKGFVPDTFIAEATMLTRLIEGYINEEGEGREGIMLFLDMEKAFDRVSYDFTLRGLEASVSARSSGKW